MQARKMYEKESELERDIGAFFLDRGIFCQKTPKLKSYIGRKITGPLSLNGLPDLFIVHNGRYIAIEVKLPGKTQSHDQKLMEAILRRNGAQYFVARSLDDAENIYKALKLLD